MFVMVGMMVGQLFFVPISCVRSVTHEKTMREMYGSVDWAP